MDSQHKKPTVFKVDLASMAAIGFFMFYVVLLSVGWEFWWL